MALASPYRRARLLSFVNPRPTSGSGYQVMQSLIGLGSGHLFGVGPRAAASAQWGFLPNAHTDFIFSVIGEQLGIVGAVAILLVLRPASSGFRAAGAGPDRFGVAARRGGGGLDRRRDVINVGAVVGVLPVTGIPLPFISFGGSSLVITMAAAGMLINVARQERLGPPRARRPAQPPRPGVTAPAARPAGTVRRPALRMVAGGGTGGHMQPALEIAQALVAAGTPGDHRALRLRRGQEAATLAGLEFPFTLLPGPGHRRSLAPGTWCATPGRWRAGVWRRVRAVGVVGRARPRVVVVVGGYASLAGAVGRRWSTGCRWSGERRRRSRGGQRAARPLRRGQRRGLRGHPLPRAHVTGTPVRPELAAVDRVARRPGRGRRRSGCPRTAPGGRVRRIARRPPDQPGGRRAVGRWAGRDDRALYHIVGRRDWARTATPAATVEPGPAPAGG